MLLGDAMDANCHTALADARNSMMLYNQFVAGSNVRKLTKAQNRLLHGPRPKPSVIKQNDYFMDGVCMAAYFPAKCRCGQPSLKK